MANIRGNSFVAIHSWIAKQLEGLDYRRFMTHMRPPVARSLSEAEGWAWYPLEYLTEIYEVITARLGHGNGKVLGDLGEFIADSDMGGAPTSKTGLLPVPRVLARLPYMWSRYRDCGEFHVLSIDEKMMHAVLTLTGYEGGEMHCIVTRTWMEKVAELMSGHKVTVLERSCRWKEGGEACYWEITWE